MKHLCIIACVSQDGGLGNAGELIWHIPEDMKFFRQTTKGHPVVMGRKTFDSIGRALPGRENLVLSRQAVKAPDVKWFDDREKLVKYLGQIDGEKFIIGGASLYQMFIDQAGIIYLTEVEAKQPADTFFPEFDRSQFSRRVLEDGEHEGVKYQIVKYERKVA